MAEIILLEDSESDALFTQRALPQAGVENPIRHLRNGKDALAYFTALLSTTSTLEPPAIILLDLKLPDITGFEVMALFRSREAFSKTLWIVLSHCNDVESVRKAYALGAHSFLSKPPTREEIEELIRTFPNGWIIARQPGEGMKDKVANRHRPEDIDEVRAHMENTGESISHHQESFAVLEAIIDEFHQSVELPPVTTGKAPGPYSSPGRKKLPKNNHSRKNCKNAQSSDNGLRFSARKPEAR